MNKSETRLCEVNGQIGYFHTWEQWSKPVEASPLKGGPPAGVLARVFAIVEFEGNVSRIDPANIKFIDFENSTLHVINSENKRMRDENLK